MRAVAVSPRVMTWVRRWALLVLLIAPTVGSAFTLDPISQVLSPSGSRARCSYQVTNDGPEPIAIAFSIAHLIKNLDGTEDLSQLEDNDFLVFPPQMVVPPGATRTVRVRWLGEPTLERERAFRFKAEQIPVEIEDPDSGVKETVQVAIRLVYRFHGTLFVRPKGAKPSVDVEETELVRAADGSAGLRVRVHNDGTMRGWIRAFVLRLTLGDQTYELTEKELPALEGLPVLAGGQREVIVPWPAELPKQQPTAATMRVVYRPATPR